MSYRIKVWSGPKVERERCDTLEEAIELVKRRVRGARRRDAVTSLGRTYAPEDIVAIRIELRGPGGRAGLDVRGDGGLVAYSGRVRRRTLDGDPYEALAQSVSAGP